MRRLLLITGSSLALACVAFGLIAWSSAAEAHLRFPVKWDEPRITATIKPGETQQIDVKLTASYDLPKMSIFVGPRIRPYVIVSTSTVGPLKKGQSAIVSLALAAPITATPTTTEGLIFLFATSTKPAFKLPLPRPLPINVAVVWSTAANLPGDVSFSYPTFGLASSISAQTADFGSAGTASIFDIALAAQTGAASTSQYLVTVMSAQGSLSISDWFAKYIDAHNTLISSATFTLRQVDQDVEALVLSGPLPANYDSGPVSEVYALSRSQKKIIAVTTSDSSTLVGIFGVSRDSLLLSYLSLLTTVTVQ